jgi:hypothetical protein
MRVSLTMKKVKVCYTVCGWIDAEVPEDLTGEELRDFVAEHIDDNVSDNDLFNGMLGGNPNKLDGDQIQIEYVEETTGEGLNEKYTMLYATDRYKN